MISQENKENDIQSQSEQYLQYMNSKNITNEQFLKKLQLDENYIQKLIEEKNKINSSIVPILKMRLETINGQQYEDLDKIDIEQVLFINISNQILSKPIYFDQVFQRYGKIIDVICKPNLIAFVIFYSMKSAVIAQQSLNNHQIKSHNILLKCEWCDQSTEEQLFPVQKYLDIEDNQININNGMDLYKLNQFYQIPKNVIDSKFQSNVPVKYTCRYEIQIDNEKEFQVARKIIGSKGFNMKKIIELCLQDQTQDVKKSQDTLKLRLRGKGSGYREGPDQKESFEPLHLCVSSKYPELYKIACKYVEELLNPIYIQYNEFCQKKNNNHQYVILKKIESLSVKNQTQNRQEECEIFKNQDFNQNIANFPQQNYQYNEQSLQSQFEQFKINKPQLILNYQFQQKQNNMFYENQLMESEIQNWIEARNKARRESNFQEADRIRNYLKEKGIALMDEKGGKGKGVEVTTWKYSKPIMHNDYGNIYQNF